MALHLVSKNKRPGTSLGGSGQECREVAGEVPVGRFGVGWSGGDRVITHHWLLMGIVKVVVLIPIFS